MFVRIGASLSGPQLAHSHSSGKKPFFWKTLPILYPTEDLYPENTKTPENPKVRIDKCEQACWGDVNVPELDYGDELTKTP